LIERRVAGDVPSKPHIAFRGGDGALRYEECLTRQGFDGPYTILYHLGRPHEGSAGRPMRGFPVPEARPLPPLARRHYRTGALPPGGTAAFSRVPLLFNEDVVLSVARPTEDDTTYFSNGDGDDLVFVLRGGGTLKSPFGDLVFRELDYVYVPKGVVHRFELAQGLEQHWLVVECTGGLGLPSSYRNAIGQLRMDAPYSHRDFRAPVFEGPRDEGLRSLVIKRGGAFHGVDLVRSPFDVIGWDGTVYPFAFSILDFQPRVGSVHLPPTVHGTFAARGALVCSFVPRPLDFHPEAVPCPYPHASVDIDEVLFYASGDFTSRRGIGVGSISHHPAGVPHGPHPGAYETSIGQRHTRELAVMLDVAAPLARTEPAASIEDPDYHASFRASAP